MIAQRGVVLLWWCGVIVVVFLWWCFCVGMVVFLWWCFCGGVLVVVFLWWCFCGGVFVVVFLWWCFCGGVFVLVFFWWCLCGGVFVLVFLWWCFCGGVFVVFLWWCFRGGVFVVVFSWWCGSVFVVVFLWWCSCGGVFVVVFLWWCFCVGMVVFLWWCFCGGVLVVVFLWWCFCGGVLVVVFLWWCFWGGVLWWCFCGGVLVVVLVWQTTRRIRRASDNFHTESFQNDRFVRCFRQFSQKKLPKWLFRAMLPTIFTDRTSKTSVSRDASDNFRRKNFQNDRFVRGFFQISQNHASKTSVSHDASDNFHRKSFQNDRFVRGFLQISQNNAPKTTTTFRAMLPTIFTKNLRFATVSRNRHTDSCERVHPPKAKCASHYNAVHSQMWQCAFRLSAVRKNVWIYPPWNRPASRTQKCEVLLQFWAIDTTSLPRGFTASKWNLRFATVLGDRHHVFTERVDREKMKFAFRYSFGRSTPRFYREGWPRENEICVSLQFWAIDTTFFVRGLTESKWNLRFATVLAIDDAFLAKGLTARKWNSRFATVLGDRRRVFSERVAFRLTLPIPPGGIE